jgi:hypothetical protein
MRFVIAAVVFIWVAPITLCLVITMVEMAKPWMN